MEHSSAQAANFEIHGACSAWYEQPGHYRIADGSTVKYFVYQHPLVILSWMKMANSVLCRLRSLPSHASMHPSFFTLAKSTGLTCSTWVPTLDPSQRWLEVQCTFQKQAGIFSRPRLLDLTGCTSVVAAWDCDPRDG